MQDIDGVAHIERLTSPIRYGRPRVQGQSILLVPHAHHGDGIRRHGGWQRHVMNDPPIGPPELKRAVRMALDLIALLVDRAMVPATQEREIRELRWPTLSPVTDVVSLPNPYAAAREATPVVAMMQHPAERGRDRAGPGADLGHKPVRVMTHYDAHRVAGQAL